MANSKDGQGHKDKYMDTSRKILLREMLMYKALTVQKLLARLKFSKKWVKLQGQGHLVKYNGTHGKGLITRNTVVKYQSSITHCSNVISKVVTMTFTSFHFKSLAMWIKPKLSIMTASPSFSCSIKPRFLVFSASEIDPGQSFETWTTTPVMLNPTRMCYAIVIRKIQRFLIWRTLYEGTSVHSRTTLVSWTFVKHSRTTLVSWTFVKHSRTTLVSWTFVKHSRTTLVSWTFVKHSEHVASELQDLGRTQKTAHRNKISVSGYVTLRMK